MSTNTSKALKARGRARAIVPRSYLEERAAVPLPIPDGASPTVHRATTYVPPKPVAPWERQPGEPARMYRGFAAYRDMGEGRSLRQVAADLHEYIRVVNGWALRWSWYERCNAWDQESDRRQTQAALKAIEKMGERHVNLSMKMQQLVAQRLQNVDPERLTNRDVDRWLEKAVRIERLARGLQEGPRLAINVQQQQAQNQTATAQAAAAGGTDAQRTIAELIASDPTLLAAVNGEIDDLLGAVEEAEHSTWNGEQDDGQQGVPGPA